MNKTKNKSNKNGPKINKSLNLKNEIKSLLESYESYDWSQFDSFDSIPLSDRTRDGLKQNGFIKPTDIQKESIGFALKGCDVLGAAKTGSGKTLAFLIPLLECLYCNEWTQMDGLGALVITPTRELSYQIFEVLRKIGSNHDFSAGLIIGGKDLNFERKRLDKCNIIICTPGRLLQHMDQNPLFNCDNLKILVLDEADRCLDLGFAQTMNAIIENLPQKRQTLLFSATQTKSVKDLARLSLKDPVYVSAHEHHKYSTPELLTQSYVVCELEDKLNMLWSFIKTHLKQKILVFMSSCKQVKYCFDLFCRLRPGTTLLSLYGTLHQLRRMSIYDEFCRKQNAVLFATDIASRGLDFPSVNWVIQMDCPEDVNTYIHRVGRTARYEKGGESLLVLLPNEENSMIQQLEDKKIPINKIEVNPSKMFSIQRKAEALCASNNTLKESAQRAFKSYVKNVFLMKDKTIFDVKKLNSDSFAHSLGLAITPRIRFIEKSDKKKISNKQNNSDINNKERDDNSHKDNNKILDVKNFNNSNNSESDENEDNLLTLKKVWRFDLDQDLDNNNTEFKAKQKKVLTKAALAKRVLKKKFKPNTRIVFNEDGERDEQFPTRQVSEKVKQLEEKNISGIDIEIAKEIMKDEDLIDKKLYRDLVKAKHKERRLKLKEEKRKEKESRNPSVILQNEGSDDDMNDITNKYIDELPDPDLVYNQQNDNSSHSDSDYEDYNQFNDKQDINDIEEEEESERPKTKRRKIVSKNKRYSQKSNDKELDLADYETLAIHLLKN
jgi:ATP-dependent RNA helicase DDX10/DBP4